jgi:hypothetical protein
MGADTAYFATALSYSRKMFTKSTTGSDAIKTFFFVANGSFTRESDFALG